MNIKQVAARAGVSTATVSYVLNKSRRVRPETAERVLKVVREMNYSINSAARTLTQGRSNLLGLVISDIRNPYYPEIIWSFQEQALSHGMEPLVMYTNYDFHRTAACADRLLGLRVPGVALLTAEHNLTLVDRLKNNGVCAVYMDHASIEHMISTITIDYGQGMREAIEHLYKLGHRRLGYITGSETVLSAGIRQRAFLECVEQLGCPPPQVVEADFTVKGGYFAAGKLLAGDPPTAIVAVNDLTAIGTLHCAFDRGLSVPRQLSVVGFDNISFTEFTQPALTTVDQPTIEIGRTAFSALWTMLSDPERAGREYHVQTRLILRQTTAEPAKMD